MSASDNLHASTAPQVEATSATPPAPSQSPPTMSPPTAEAAAALLSISSIPQPDTTIANPAPQPTIQSIQEQFYRSLPSDQRNDWICMRYDDMEAMQRLLFTHFIHRGCMNCQIRGYDCYPVDPPTDGRLKCTSCYEVRSSCDFTPLEFWNNTSNADTLADKARKRLKEEGYLQGGAGVEDYSDYVKSFAGVWVSGGLDLHTRDLVGDVPSREPSLVRMHGRTGKSGSYYLNTEPRPPKPAKVVKSKARRTGTPLEAAETGQAEEEEDEEVSEQAESTVGSRTTSRTSTRRSSRLSAQQEVQVDEGQEESDDQGAASPPQKLPPRRPIKSGASKSGASIPSASAASPPQQLPPRRRLPSGASNASRGVGSSKKLFRAETPPTPPVAHPQTPPTPIGGASPSAAAATASVSPLSPRRIAASAKQQVNKILLQSRTQRRPQQQAKVNKVTQALQAEAAASMTPAQYKQQNAASGSSTPAVPGASAGNVIRRKKSRLIPWLQYSNLSDVSMQGASQSGSTSYLGNAEAGPSGSSGQRNSMEVEPSTSGHASSSAASRNRPLEAKQQDEEEIDELASD